MTILEALAKELETFIIERLREVSPGANRPTFVLAFLQKDRDPLIAGTASEDEREDLANWIKQAIHGPKE